MMMSTLPLQSILAPIFELFKSVRDRSFYVYHVTIPNLVPPK
jgi:hypothetical protein